MDKVICMDHFMFKNTTNKILFRFYILIKAELIFNLFFKAYMFAFKKEAPVSEGREKVGQGEGIWGWEVVEEREGEGKGNDVVIHK